MDKNTEEKIQKNRKTKQAREHQEKSNSKTQR